MSVFLGELKTEETDKNPLAVSLAADATEIQHLTQPTYGVDAATRTQATLLGGECSHSCAILVPHSLVSHGKGRDAHEDQRKLCDVDLQKEKDV